MADCEQMLTPVRLMQSWSCRGWVEFGMLAAVFGLRHAFDADNVAAIDNTTRKVTVGARNPGPSRRCHRR